MKPYFSVVVPVYRSEKNLSELYARIKASLEKLNANFELILVEDCGGDDSWRVIQELSEQDSRVIGIRFTKNFGQHAAIICGIAQANGEWIITLDDDLEQRPEDIHLLYEKVRQGYDLVYGTYEERSHAKWRNMTSHVARKLFNKAIPNLNYEYTSFRIMHNKIGKSLVQFESPFPFVDGYLAWVTNNYSTVTVEHGVRKHGVSNYSFSKLLKHTINIFVSFSDIPLKFASWMGLFSFITGFMWLVVILFRKLFIGIPIAGYASIIAGIVLFGGIQLFVLGIFGEYLGRINYKTTKKPLYIVSKTTNEH
ncbi:glycosyltransferase family 2 protein [Paenibacillus taiwanensis]|uniref:glycosyltransferase family 2 protein n=1 Tax=Paenibacillus taiwanensis TaxID=401638 RepID=UPI00040F4085|nr:glycosyltransferase family 2 protein [Paenibacillus taiwanensis]